MKKFTGKIIDSIDLMNKQNENSFNGTISPVLFQPGDILFRFCNNTEAKYSDCWTNKETLKLIFQSYHERNMSRPLGNKNAQVKGQVYTTLGIAKTWSSLEYLISVEIKKELIAYEGIIEKQSFFQDVDSDSELRKIMVIGGGAQFIIPRIKNYSKDKNLLAIHQLIKDVEVEKFLESSWYKRLVTGGYFLPFK